MGDWEQVLCVFVLIGFHIAIVDSKTDAKKEEKKEGGNRQGRKEMEGKREGRERKRKTLWMNYYTWFSDSSLCLLWTRSCPCNSLSMVLGTVVWTPYSDYLLSWPGPRWLLMHPKIASVLFGQRHSCWLPRGLGWYLCFLSPLKNLLLSQICLKLLICETGYFRPGLKLLYLSH